MSMIGINMSDYHTFMEKETKKNAPGASFALHMADADRAASGSRALGTAVRRSVGTGTFSPRDHYVTGESHPCAVGTYSKESAFRTMTPDEEPPDRQGRSVLSDREPNASSGEEDTNTSSEIIIRPDGSRVLMITVDIGGAQSVMSLQISEPTDMQNDISNPENDSGETPAYETEAAPVILPDTVSEA